ncbi:radical SAM family heme chaperone HemW [Corynebacterium auriscanis]|uniref:Heme chaperone HemW n=1 Tax=Corynebacterium auriscanis TaxID=99807 RepID=A0A0A2DIU4_9CORY|nr:radical SAM family heme chaperone HemW [Corynebacterium auriscanis]KGM19093.1 coproporphyrinogen III oxidase [Corynebacterium auriscanis]MCX2163390.1 radical SAM family heme chaperone HemW [Corynebacterium auriscanis]WJY72360.1 Oxygen-independent coproporphyrinogen-III oxidase 1 [Corynebacterium auriscanis]
MTERGLYIHVPFCASRCGYCDFNTYTPLELAADSSTQATMAARGNTIDGYLDALERELEYAAQLWEPEPGRAAGTAIDTVFFGGGTPSMLGAEGLTRALRAVKRTFGLAPGAEVTTESNPESTSPQFFEALRAEGFTRISLGMQSAVGHVLKVLERQHTPGRSVAAAREARAAGFDHVNLDLIYGTPTETDEDLRTSLEAVLSAGVDHVSAYSLIVEDGTAMARKVRRGELPAPDEDVLADRYRMIDEHLTEAGFGWYEVSNWAKPGGECRHNLVYWRSGQWWGAGPGAHGCVQLKSHVNVGEPPVGFSGLTRLVNAKRPATYWQGLMERGVGNKLPESVVTVEQLTRADLATEKVMLGLRLREGLDLNVLHPTAQLDKVLSRYRELGLANVEGDKVVLTDEGRYLADGIVTDIVLSQE